MNAKTRRAWRILALVVLVATGVGWFAVRRISPALELNPAKAIASPPAVANGRGVTDEINAPASAPPPAPAADVAHLPAADDASRVAPAVALPQRTPLLFDPIGGRTSRAFVEKFNLSPDERAALDRAVDQARERMGELSLAHASVRIEGDGSIVIDVRSFAEGGPLYDELLRAFALVLGPERHAVFLREAAEPLEKALAQLGLQPRSITLRHDAATADRNEYYHVRVQAGSHGLVLSGRSFETTRRYLGPLVRLLPADF